MSEAVQGAGLGGLARRIDDEHRAVERSVRSALEHARRAGGLLIEAKAKVPHGQWLPWLEENFAGSVRTAQTYMRVSRELPDAQAPAHLTLEEAVASVAQPRDRLRDLEAGLEEDLDRLRRSLRELHDGGAARALGYATWTEFVVREFMPNAPAPAGDRELRATFLALLLEPAVERPGSR